MCMMQSKKIKALSLLLCISLMMCLAACKGGVAPDGADSSADVQQNVQSGESVVPNESGNNNTEGGAGNKKPSSSNSALQGVELEEDVFDNSDTSTNTSADNASNSTSSADGNQSSENESDESSSDDSVSEEISSGNDGTIKLPVDWF